MANSKIDIKSHRLLYIAGKGNYLVPVLIPHEMASVGKHLAAFDGEFKQEGTAGPGWSERIVRKETMEEEDDGKENVRKETMEEDSVMMELIEEEEEDSVMMELIEEEDDENEVSRRDRVEQKIKKTRSIKKGKEKIFPVTKHSK
ncbi:hypothetical protein CAPTEDRAFT_197123 [Capitella teleta]|uniref:Uncharacterized protein n=1 Tax=Capitella teleta TaxID=283909 RepID=R7TJN6_CAPTE|nr:hypothetical protein CAPTEDRAFT_197123 [Capitella teleta]|eukprot:ELT93712.1 hypothetical protein CAPTEDRAFT_197123 [Capitella teleta]